MNIDCNGAFLPPELWENIFNYLPCRYQWQVIQRVNKQFHAIVASMPLSRNPFMNLLRFCSMMDWPAEKTPPSQQAILHAVIPILRCTGISLTPNKELFVHYCYGGRGLPGYTPRKMFASVSALLFNTATNQISERRNVSPDHLWGKNFSCAHKAGQGFFIKGMCDKRIYYANICDVQKASLQDPPILWLELSECDYYLLTRGGIYGSDFLQIGAGEKKISEGIVLTYTSTALFTCHLTAENQNGTRCGDKTVITAPYITHVVMNIDRDEEKPKVLAAAKLIRSGDDVLAIYLVIEQQEEQQKNGSVYTPTATIHMAKLDFTATQKWRPQQSMSYIGQASRSSFVNLFHYYHFDCDFGFLDGICILGFQNTIVVFDSHLGEKIITFPIAADSTTIIRQIELTKNGSDGDIGVAVVIDSGGSTEQKVYVFSTTPHWSFATPR